jgi:hypothetical protein
MLLPTIWSDLSSDLIAVTVGVIFGFAMVGLVLWRHRVEVKQTWQARFGSASQSPTTASESSDGGGGRHALSPTARRFGIGLSLLVSLGNVALAAWTAEARPLHVIAAVVFAVSAGVLTLRSRPQER